MHTATVEMSECVVFMLHGVPCVVGSSLAAAQAVVLTSVVTSFTTLSTVII